MSAERLRSDRCDKSIRIGGHDAAVIRQIDVTCFPTTKSKFASATTKPTPKASSTTPITFSTSSWPASSSCWRWATTTPQLERDGIILVVNKIACKYHRPCKFGDTLRLQIRTVRARGARIDHEYRLLRGNELLAEAESTLACIDREGRVQRLPEFSDEP